MVHNNVSADPIIHYNGYFGRGLDFPVWSYMRCFGWEDVWMNVQKMITLQLTFTIRVMILLELNAEIVSGIVK